MVYPGSMVTHPSTNQTWCVNLEVQCIQAASEAARSHTQRDTETQRRTHRDGERQTHISNAQSKFSSSCIQLNFSVSRLHTIENNLAGMTAGRNETRIGRERNGPRIHCTTTYNMQFTCKPSLLFCGQECTKSSVDNVKS